MTDSQPRPIRYVVLHTPGPKWQYGIDYREQPGVSQHIQHYLNFHEQGKLELGGPFLVPDVGGMMVATKDITGKNSRLSLQLIRLCSQGCLSMKSVRG